MQCSFRPHVDSVTGSCGQQGVHTILNIAVLTAMDAGNELTLRVLLSLQQQSEIKPQPPAQPAAPADEKPASPVARPQAHQQQQDELAASPAEAAPAAGSSGRDADAKEAAPTAAPTSVPAGLEGWKGKVALVTGGVTPLLQFFSTCVSDWRNSQTAGARSLPR